MDLGANPCFGCQSLAMNFPRMNSKREVKAVFCWVVWGGAGGRAQLGHIHLLGKVVGVGEKSKAVCLQAFRIAADE